MFDQDWDSNATKYWLSYKIEHFTITAEVNLKNDQWYWEIDVHDNRDGDTEYHHVGIEETTENAMQEALKIIEQWKEYKMPQEISFYTIPAAAKATGLEVRTLSRAVNRGAVKSIKVEGSPIKLVTLDDVRKWKDNEYIPKPRSPKSDT